MSGAANQEILVRRDGRVATLAICRPAKSNALAQRHFRRMAALLTELDADPDVGSIVLTGEGDRAFCAGADLSAGERFLDGLASGGAGGLGDVLRVAHGLSKPLIGRVNGACYAGGVGLLAACDLAVACEEARFALPEVKLGIFPFVVLAALRHRIASVHLTRLALTGEPVGAAEAFKIGLVSHVVPRSGLDSMATFLAEELAGLPAGTLRAGLRMCRGGDAGAYGAALAEAERQGHAVAASITTVDRGHDHEREIEATGRPIA